MAAISRRTVKFVALGSAVLVLLPLAVACVLLRASLPAIDASLTGSGVSTDVVIERDALGIPTVRAATRLDLAYGTGFVHGQDRFFQMDLARRLAAGELAELFGAAALEQDEKARTFRFRRVAAIALGQASSEQRAIIAAYTRGVNAALSGLRSRPWEYWVLRSAPLAWRDEDTFLISYSMWWDLQYGGFERERLKQAINARLEGAECASGWKCTLQLFYPAHTVWDAPNPSPSAAAALARIWSRGGDADATTVRDAALAPARRSDAGSNNWALAGALSAAGAALVASDMHLSLRVPTVWYRARLQTAARAHEAGLDLNGLTLPGSPLLVAGSNGHVAWAFTNSYGKWLELKTVECVSVSDSNLQSAAGSIPLTTEREVIRVRGAPSVLWNVRSAAQGVLLQVQPEQRHCEFGRWLAQVPEATNFNLQAMERAASVDEVLALAPGIGIPHQNLIVGDRAGHIAWTIFGRIPLEAGAQRLSGQGPWTSAAQHPHLADPAAGRLWSANARPIDDARAEALLGGDEAQTGAGYALGARAQQIRDDLAALNARATPADMLRVQLDDRAVFLARWRSLALELLDARALAAHPRRAEFKRLIDAWDARAGVDSVGYRLVREFHEETEGAVWQRVLRGLDIGANAPPPERFEQALWMLVSTRPPGKLAPDAGGWRELLLGRIDATIAALEATCAALAHCTWGSHRPVHIRHPLSAALPFIGRFLDMPARELPGDHDMPRVQDGAFGASERFAVSPGHEAQGYLHIAGGQSGHPLSPFYRAGFDAWAAGEPLPFLPGSVQHRLTLRP